MRNKLRFYIHYMPSYNWLLMVLIVGVSMVGACNLGWALMSNYLIMTFIIVADSDCFDGNLKFELVGCSVKGPEYLRSAEHINLNVNTLVVVLYNIILGFRAEFYGNVVLYVGLLLFFTFAYRKNNIYQKNNLSSIGCIGLVMDFVLLFVLLIINVPLVLAVVSGILLVIDQVWRIYLNGRL